VAVGIFIFKKIEPDDPFAMNNGGEEETLSQCRVNNLAEAIQDLGICDLLWLAGFLHHSDLPEKEKREKKRRRQ